MAFLVIHSLIKYLNDVLSSINSSLNISKYVIDIFYLYYIQHEFDTLLYKKLFSICYGLKWWSNGTRFLFLYSIVHQASWQVSTSAYEKKFPPARSSVRPYSTKVPAMICLRYMTLNENMLLLTLRSEVTPTTLTLGSVEAFLMLLGDLGRSAWRGEAGWECGGPLDWLWEWCRGMAGSGVTACTGRGRRVASRLRELFLFSHIICTSSILFSTCSTGHTCL